MTTQQDSLKWTAHAHVDKYSLDQVRYAQHKLGLEREPVGAELAAFFATPEFGSIDSVGNSLTTIGLKRVWNTFSAQASVATIDGTTRGRVGTGDDSSAFAVGDVDLAGATNATNQYYQRFDAAPAKATNGVFTVIATFPTGQGNYHWQAWGIDGGTASSGTKVTDADATPGLINRKVTDLGTKTSAASWVFTVTLTLS